MQLEFLVLSTYITVILIHRLITIIIGKIDYNDSLPGEPFDCLDGVLFWFGDPLLSTCWSTSHAPLQLPVS